MLCYCAGNRNDGCGGPSGHAWRHGVFELFGFPIAVSGLRLALQFASFFITPFFITPGHQQHVLRQQQHSLATPAPSGCKAEAGRAFGFFVESRWNAIAGLATGLEAILFGPCPEKSQGGSPALAGSQPNRYWRQQGQQCRRLVLHAAQGGHCRYGLASAQG